MSWVQKYVLGWTQKNMVNIPYIYLWILLNIQCIFKFIESFQDASCILYAKLKSVLFLLLAISVINGLEWDILVDYCALDCFYHLSVLSDFTML